MYCTIDNGKNLTTMLNKRIFLDFTSNEITATHKFGVVQKQLLPGPIYHM